MKDKHNEQDNEVLVHGKGEAYENRMENNAEFQDRDADYLSGGGVGAGIRGRGGLLVPLFVVNVVVTARGVALCGSG